jgi:hypothetical protein
VDRICVSRLNQLVAFIAHVLRDLNSKCVPVLLGPFRRHNHPAQKRWIKLLKTGSALDGMGRTTHVDARSGAV